MMSNGLNCSEHEASATKDVASGSESCVLSSVDVTDRSGTECATKPSGDCPQSCDPVMNSAPQVPSLDLPSTVDSPRTSRRIRLTKDVVSLECVSTLSPVTDQTKRFHSVIESIAEKSKVEITSEALQSTYHLMELKDIAGKLWSSEADLSAAIEALVPKLKESIVLLKSKVLGDIMQGIKQTELLIEEGWSSRGIGRDLAYELCNILRVEGGLDELISDCDDASLPLEIQFGAAHLLSRTLTVTNRDHIAKASALQRIVNWALRVQKNPEFCRAATAILECMFKHSKNTCTLLIKMGGLDAVLYSCRSLDIPIRRYCAKAMANLAIYGGYRNQFEMIKYNAAEWLFPLAFTEDDSTRYYALLAIAALCASKETEAAVVHSGTLDLVAPFLRTHDPLEFGSRDPENIHGQAKEWLGRLLQFLPCRREETRSLIAFHFAIEAGIRRKQNKLHLFREIGAIVPLKRLASCPSKLTSKFASQALKIIGEDLPNKLPPRVPLWTNENVVCWIQQLGFSMEIVLAFKECQVDGDLLLSLMEENLMDDIGIKNGIVRKRFMRELNELRQTADYRSIDSSHLNDWLCQLGPEFRRYTYQMLKSRVTVTVLPKLREEHLLKDCGVLSGVHRLLILDAAKNIPSDVSNSPSTPVACDSKRNIDVFISYRRKNGSMLASLIKVYLQILGYSVFIDIEKLPVGKFDENLLKSIGRSQCFILVLSSNALDRCIGDNQGNDWIHKEVAAAIKSNCQIIPVLDNFDWPPKEKLPEDMRDIVSYHGIVWSHDLQDACITRLCSFLNSTEPSNTQHGATASEHTSPGGIGIKKSGSRASGLALPTPEPSHEK